MSQFKIKLWGVRGSLPRPEIPQALADQTRKILEEFAASKQSVDAFLRGKTLTQIGGFGGNTTCVSATFGDQRLIIDCGSGVRELAGHLLAGPLGKGQGQAHILLTHFHWDHLIGLPFFVPVFIPGNQLHFYAVQPELEAMVRGLFARPYFPVEFKALGAKIHFHQLKPRERINIEGFDVTPYQLDHPDPCWGYKIERSGKAYSHCVDTECTRITREELGADLPLYQGVNLMYFDAQYTLKDIVDKANWGHSVASFGLDLALREGIKQILFAHHDPFATTEKTFEAESQARLYYESKIEEFNRQNRAYQPVDWSFAVEGMELSI